MSGDKMVIRGEDGYFAARHGLNEQQTHELYELFRGQAMRWEQKVRACEERIRNQREELEKMRSL